MKQEVLLLSAGFGTRLGELTKDKPKPLVEINNKKLIEINLEHLSNAGYEKVFINTHYKAEKIVEFVSDGSKWGLDVCYSHEEEILDTGGAVAKIANSITSDNLLILNSDIVIDENFSFKSLTNFHLNKKSQATLVVKSDANLEINGQLGLDSNNKIVKFLNYKYSDDFTPVFFTGISLINKSIFTRSFSNNKFSLTKDLFLNCLKSGESLLGYLMDSYWCDAGTPERLKQAEFYLRNN